MTPLRAVVALTALTALTVATMAAASLRGCPCGGCRG